MSNQTLTNLERAVLEKMLTGNEPVFEVIKSQLKLAVVSKKELTGTGFYAYFTVPDQAEKLPEKGKLMIGDVSAEIPELQSGADFILWIENGIISSLEGFTYDEAWPAKITDFKLVFLNEKPHGSGKLWHSDTRDMDFALRKLGSGT